MKIHGLQKLTLLDYPGRMACTVFLGGCNLRCPFCHNSELLDAAAPAEMDEQALLDFLKKRVGMLEGVCFTGGEPLLRPELPALMEQIRSMGYLVKLDTNGTMPARLRQVLEGGCADYVAMDIKHDPARYARTSGLADMELQPVYESIELLRSGGVDYEFRTTVVDELHDADSFRAIGPMIRGARRYYLQPFTDRDTVMFAGFHAPEKEKLLAYADIVRPDVDRVEIRGLT